MDYAEFQKQVSLSKKDICREAFADNRNTIRVKKEGTVVKNLERIFDATLKISNKKGFQAMSMRDLSKETNLSMGALYSSFSSKEELLGEIMFAKIDAYAELFDELRGTDLDLKEKVMVYLGRGSKVLPRTLRCFI